MPQSQYFVNPAAALYVGPDPHVRRAINGVRGTLEAMSRELDLRLIPKLLARITGPPVDGLHPWIEVDQPLDGTFPDAARAPRSSAMTDYRGARERNGGLETLTGRVVEISWKQDPSTGENTFSFNTPAVSGGIVPAGLPEPGSIIVFDGDTYVYTEAPAAGDTLIFNSVSNTWVSISPASAGACIDPVGETDLRDDAFGDNDGNEWAVGAGLSGKFLMQTAEYSTSAGGVTTYHRKWREVQIDACGRISSIGPAQSEVTIEAEECEEE